MLVADSGVRGLVIRARGGEIRRIDATRVRADASVTINGLVRWTINHGCAGLEAWAGTPGTVGGAVFGNAHFAGRLVGDLVTGVRVVTRAGVAVDVPRADMSFGYEGSRLRDTGEILLWAEFAVGDGDPASLRSDGARVARVPEAHAAARHAERGLRLQEPAAGPRRGA